MYHCHSVLKLPVFITLQLLIIINAQAWIRLYTLIKNQCYLFTQSLPLCSQSYTPVWIGLYTLIHKTSAICWHTTHCGVPNHIHQSESGLTHSYTKPVVFVDTLLTVKFLTMEAPLSELGLTHSWIHKTSVICWHATHCGVPNHIHIHHSLNQAWPTHTQNQCYLLTHYSLWCSQSVWAGTSVWTSWPRRASEDELVLRREIPAPGLYPVLLSHWHWKTKKGTGLYPLQSKKN